MKKPSIAMLLLGKEKGKPEEEEEHVDHDEHLKEAAEELCSAIEAKDAEKVVKAFKVMHELCCAAEEEEDGEDEDEEEEAEEDDDHEYGE